jgi:hypothetical protein
MLLVIALAVPAMAALKVLPEELSQELEQIAKEYYAAEKNVSADSLEVTEGWVRELFNIDREIYVVVIGEKDSVYVDVMDKTALSEEEMEALIAEDLANEPDEPIFRTMAIGIGAEDGEVNATEAEEKSNTVYYVGAALVAGLGAGTLLLKSRNK